MNRDSLGTALQACPPPPSLPASGQSWGPWGDRDARDVPHTDRQVLPGQPAVHTRPVAHTHTLTQEQMRRYTEMWMCVRAYVCAHCSCIHVPMHISKEHIHTHTHICWPGVIPPARGWWQEQLRPLRQTDEIFITISSNFHPHLQDNLWPACQPWRDNMLATKWSVPAV